MFQDFKTIFPQAMRKAGIDRQVAEAGVLKYFEEIKDKFLSPDLADKVRAMYYKNGYLAIASLSTRAVQELTFSENQIIELLNSNFGQEFVKKLKFIV
ncbi:MAG: DUF721 domain-containing protein [Patescibacteria group bacterium]|nr:DUF721 domain-containing protein [Patescibacteria group bacterium]MDD4610899.1 DUF721 domain-containing protein [Patescibacteria group bacterium]